jgi:hypothetical protein
MIEIYFNHNRAKPKKVIPEQVPKKDLGLGMLVFQSRAWLRRG